MMTVMNSVGSSRFECGKKQSEGVGDDTHRHVFQHSKLGESNSWEGD